MLQSVITKGGRPLGSLVQLFSPRGCTYSGRDLHTRKEARSAQRANHHCKTQHAQRVYTGCCFWPSPPSSSTNLKAGLPKASRMRFKCCSRRLSIFGGMGGSVWLSSTPSSPAAALAAVTLPPVSSSGMGCTRPLLPKSVFMRSSCCSHRLWCLVPSPTVLPCCAPATVLLLACWSRVCLWSSML